MNEITREEFNSLKKEVAELREKIQPRERHETIHYVPVINLEGFSNRNCDDVVREEAEKFIRDFNAIYSCKNGVFQRKTRIQTFFGKIISGLSFK